MIAVTDGTHIEATASDGRHWTAVQLSGATGSFYVSKLGGLLAGKAVVLCSDSPATVGPGETDVQVRIAARLGGTFTNSVLPAP